MSMYRFQVEVPEATGAAVDALQQILGTPTKKDLFENALTLLSWAVREVRRGRIISSIDEANQKYSELVLPVLQHAARQKQEMEFETKPGKQSEAVHAASMARALRSS